MNMFSAIWISVHFGWMNYICTNTLTEVAGEGGPDLAPQKIYCPNSLGTSWDAKNM